MNGRSFYCLLIAVCLSFFRPAFAETPVPETLSLSLPEALGIAVRENPDILAAEFTVEASRAGLDQARSGFMPRVDLMETFNRTTNPMWVFGAKLNQESIDYTDFDPAVLHDPGELNNYATALTLTWPVFAGGKIYHGVKQAEKQLDAQTLAFVRTRQEIIARTATAYLGMMLAREGLKVVEQSLASARANFKMVESAFDAGLVVKSDLLRAQVMIADLEQQRLQAESRIQTARAGLNAAMGRPVETPLMLTSSFETCCPVTGDGDAWIATALANRPDLKQLSCLEETAERSVAIARADHYPSLRLVGSYDINSEDFSDTADSYTVGAVMSLNLFRGFGVSSGIRGAKASLNSLRQSIKSMELAIRVQTQSAFFETQSAWQRIGVAKAALDQADEGLRIVKNRYKSGLLTIVGLLDAELANQQAKTSYYTALHDYKTAMVNLELAAGIINENVVYGRPEAGDQSGR